MMCLPRAGISSDAGRTSTNTGSASAMRRSASRLAVSISSNLCPSGCIAAAARSMLARMTTGVQVWQTWPVKLWGAAARRAVLAMSGTAENPLPPGEAPSKNPLPLGEGRVRVVSQGSDERAFGPTSPHPDPLPVGEGGKVIAVFARSFYLASAAGELVCIGPAGLGSGPLNMLCDLPRDLDWQARGLRPGQLARYRDKVLHIDGIGAFALAGAVVWRPTPPPAVWNAAILDAGLAALATASRNLASTDGFAPLVAMLALNNPTSARDTGEPLHRLAAPGIVAVAEWLARGGEGAPDEAAASLLGLGPGLTPSGDDFLGGAMIALHALGRGAVAARLAGWVLPLATARTGAISAAHLACAAAGEASAALHDFLAALLTPGAAGLAEAVEALAALGHSSGWDMLAGAALACAVMCNDLSC